MTMPDATTGREEGILTLPLLTLGAHEEFPAIWQFPYRAPAPPARMGRGGLHRRCNCRNNSAKASQQASQRTIASAPQVGTCAMSFTPSTPIRGLQRVLLEL